MALNIIFWNLKKSITPSTKMLSLVDDVLLNEPDVFCVAEGPVSFPNNESLTQHMIDKGYNCFFSPSLYNSLFPEINTTKILFGLKLFIKKEIISYDSFGLENLQLDGRIIYLRLAHKNTVYSNFFIHGYSTIIRSSNQSTTVDSLSSFIREKSRKHKSDKIIVIGDFNIEPWEYFLCDSRWISSYFSDKKFNYHVGITKEEIEFFNKKIFFNPIIKYIESNPEHHLISTFYNNEYNSIIDFPLLTNDIVNYEMRIITALNGKTLFKIAPKSKKVTLDRGIDHLPILLKLK